MTPIRPERSSPATKRAIIFSPHPDDDARRFAEFYVDLSNAMGADLGESKNLKEEVISALETKEQRVVDHELVRTIKGLIRKGEAASGARFVGLPDENIHFLNLPFYEKGTVEKKGLGDADIEIVTDLLNKVKPHQVFAAGDLRDPHGTHKVCLDAIFKSLSQTKSEPWSKDCYLWLYRGVWQEWDVEEIEMAIPLIPMGLMKKRRAIFKHQSQKDTPVFLGSDKREFWQRA